MESPQSWEAYFVDHGEALERGAWSSLAGAVAAAIAGREEREQALKRFARALWRGPSLLDPWRVECVLRQPPLCELRFGRSPLRACSLPALGALEPDLALRTLALARAALEALDRAEGAEGAARPERGSAREADRPASACPEALAAQDAGREVWWWLTGASPPEASGDAQARVRAAFAETVHHTLAHTGALGTASLEARRAVIDAWRSAAPRSAPDDAAAAFVREHDARAEWPRLAIEIVIDSIRNPSEGRLAAARAARLYDTLRAESLAGAPEGLAAWCQAAHAIGILGEAPFETDTLARRRDALARGLADTLGRALAATHARPDRPPLDFALWQALVVLARERASVEDWHALARLWLVADHVTLTGGIARRVARLCDVLAELGGEQGQRLACALVARLAYRTARDRGEPWARLHKSATSRALSAIAEPAVARQLESWLGPRDESEEDASSPESLVEVTRWVAGSELSGDDLDPEDCLRWWELDPQRNWLKRCAGEARAPRLARVPELLRSAAQAAAQAPVAARASDAPLRLVLALDRLRGRHGELYTTARVFGVRHDGLSVLLRDDAYEVPVDRRAQLGELEAALGRLRGAAERGRVGRSVIDSVQRALGSLASRRFWAELGGLLSAPGARLQILDEDFGVPWELVPVPDAAGKWVPIASLAPVVRPRSITTAAPAPARSFLLLADAAHPGALDEVAALEEALASLGARTRIALALDGVEDALGAGVYDVVHYAGHQGPTEDATPSLSMAGGSLPLARLLDGLHARPPSLLFLHACSTLLPSRVVATDAASHTRYGALEPLERSNVPAVAGTLWDVSPPEDRVFIDVFYDHLVRHGDASAAMFAARSAASRRTHWAAWWPAYVLMSA